MPWKQIEPMNQRIEFVLESLHTDNFRSLCQDYGISPKTGYKWRERFMAQGVQGMEEHSRRPQSSPRGLEEGVVCDIVRIKQQHLAWGPRKIRAIYSRTHPQSPSESSFKRVLERAGYTEKRRLRPKSQTGRLGSGRRAQAANEIWTVDFKGWWYGGPGRCQPLTVRDEFSRYLLELRALPNAQSQTVRAVFERLFETRGLPQAIRSDNGPPFGHVAALLGLTQLSAWWVALGIDLERNRPGCPQDNPAHERLHLDIGRELEAERVSEQAVFDQWRRSYNEERPHEALGMRLPAELYCPSTRKYEGTPADLSYRGMETRRVQKTGHIVWERHGLFISTALQGWSVGLQARDEGLYDVWFGRLLLGQLDPQTASFRRTPATPKDLEKAQEQTTAAPAR
jgi:transposase InsO family protein